MIFRQMNLNHLSAMDELDIFGFFKKNGLQKVNCDINEEVWATDYTQEWDEKYNLLNRRWFMEFTAKNLL